MNRPEIDCCPTDMSKRSTPPQRSPQAAKRPIATTSTALVAGIAFWASLSGTAAQAQNAAGTPAPAQDNALVRPSWQGALSQGQTLALDFETPLDQLPPLVILLGREDITAQFQPVGPRRLQASFAQAPLPTGEHQMVVMQATSPVDWVPMASLPISVTPPTANWRLGGTVGIKGQAWADPDGVALPPARPTYADLTSQLSVTGKQGDDDASIEGQWLMSGSSHQPEAVQFPVQAGSAPKPDVLSFKTQAQARSPWGRTILSLGQVQTSANPLLAPSLGHRGVTLSHQWNDQLDLTLGVQAGGQLLGARNLTGTEDEGSRFTTARVGWEVQPERPGALRLELGWFEGEQAPLPLYNITPGIVQQQQSTGWGWQVSGSTEDARWQWDLSSARSRYQSSEPGLPNSSGWRWAHAGHVGVDIVPATTWATLWGEWDLALNANVRQDYAQALYQSLAGGPLGDYQSQAATLNGQLGMVNWNASLERTHDNVHDDLTLTKNHGRTTTWGATLPMDRMAAAMGLTSAAGGGAWWPQLSYQFTRNHAWGDPGFVPLDMFIEDLPDALNTEHRMGLQWAIGSWTCAYTATASKQDTLQALYAEQDMRMRGQKLDIQWRATSTLSLGGSVGQTHSSMLDTGTRQRQNQLALDGRWRVSQGLQVSGQLTHGESLLPNGPITTTYDTLQLGLQGQAALPWGPQGKQRAQWFTRLAASRNAARSHASGLASSARLRALQAGLSITF
jgi:hypothetical protein